jgi:hypothetical protein
MPLGKSPGKALNESRSEEEGSMRGMVAIAMVGSLAVAAVCFAQTAPLGETGPATPAAPAGTQQSVGAPIETPGGSLPGNPLLPDLTLQDVKYELIRDNYCAQPGGKLGQLFNLLPVIVNNGKVPTGPFHVKIDSSEKPDGPYKRTGNSKLVEDVKPGEVLTLRHFQFSNCDGVKYYQVTVDSENAVTESSEKNNTERRRY